MKVGLELLLAENGWLGRAPRYSKLRDLALQAEAAGFDALWCYDHLLYRVDPHPAEGVWEGWTVLSALAEATSTIGLGSLVSCTGFRSPALQAKMTTTLDEVSAGRFTLGLGAGWNEAELAAYGFALDHRVARFEEAVEIIRGLLQGDEVSFAGRYHRTDRCVLLPRGPSPVGPRILVAAMRPRMLRAAARWADAWNGGYAAVPGDMAGLRDDLARACDEVGRDPATLALTTEVKVGYPDLHPPPALFEDRYLTGPAEHVAAGLHAFAEAGFAEVMCTCSPNTPEALDRLAEGLAAYRTGGG